MYNAFAKKFLGYTYENMENDLGIFSRIFTEIIHVDSLGKTADKREIYHLIIGRQEAAEKILLIGGIHGREYLTSQLVMEQAAEFLTLYYKKQHTYRKHTYEELLKGRAIHVLPMLNPDGVTISQYGARGIRDEKLRKNLWEIAAREGGRMPCGQYFMRWKSNARGVDLNRNFSAFWEEYKDKKQWPSCEKYKGSCPESETESKAVADLVRKEKFLRTISYHSAGQVIYWNFGQEGLLREESLDFAKRVGKVTGYALDGNYSQLDPAGFKDWAILEEKIPSLTIEIGSGTSPLSQNSFREILRENRGIWEETLLSLENREKPLDVSSKG